MSIYENASLVTVFLNTSLSCTIPVASSRAALFFQALFFSLLLIYVTLSGKINHLVLFMKSEIIIPPESPSIAIALIFLIGLTVLELWAFKCGQYAGLFNPLSPIDVYRRHLDPMHL